MTAPETAHPAEYVRVSVDLRFSYNLPADLAKREEMYGTTDAAECIRIDLDNDPAVFLLDSDMEVLTLHTDGSPDA